MEKIDSNRFRHIINQRPSVSILKNMLVNKVIPEINRNMAWIEILEKENIWFSKYRYKCHISTYDILENMEEYDEPRKFCMSLHKCLDELDRQCKYIERLKTA